MQVRMIPRASPLNITGLIWLTTPTYPVSSFSSLTAASSAVSPASIRPAGISMMTLSIGGRYCFCKIISNAAWLFLTRLCLASAHKRYAPPSFSRRAMIPTPSISESCGLVVRSACSHVRVLPRGSVYVDLGDPGSQWLRCMAEGELSQIQD